MYWLVIFTSAWVWTFGNYSTLEECEAAAFGFTSENSMFFPGRDPDARCVRMPDMGSTHKKDQGRLHGH